MYKEADWYLIQCKPRESFRAEMHLRNQGFECFHPTHPIKKNNAGSIQTIQAPLFPYYLFVCLTPLANWSSLRSTRGVRNVVCFNQKPACVQQSLIEGLMQQCVLLNQLEPPALFKPGDQVLIKEGCFKELQAIVTAERGEDRVMLLLNLFNRQHELEFPMNELEAWA